MQDIVDLLPLVGTHKNGHEKKKKPFLLKKKYSVDLD